MIGEKKIEKLIAMGASRWKKAGRDRLYLNKAFSSMLNLKISYYNTGNISSAYIGDEKISNSKAYKILAYAPKVYIDLKKDELIMDFIETSDASYLKAILTEAIEKL